MSGTISTTATISTTVTISTAVLAAVRVAAAVEPEHEVCGLLTGSTSEIAGVIAAMNVATDRRRRFEVDPAVLLAAHKAGRSGGPAVVGSYHSHPGGRAEPSAIDAAMIGAPGELWLIVADGRIACWRATASPGFDPVELIVDD